MSMASDFGVLGEDCKAMVVISEKGMKLGKDLVQDCETRFKLTHRAPNIKDQNVWAAVNVARKDEAEWPWSQADRPRVGRPAPPYQVWAPAF